MAEDNLRPNSAFCNWCGNPISGQKLIGSQKKYCSAECRTKCGIAIANFKRFSWSQCSNDGCENRVRSKSAKFCNPCYRVVLEKRAGICTVQKCNNPATRVGHGLCENHYGRIRRTGNTETKPRVLTQIANGYMMIKAEGHPMAAGNGFAFEHRIIAYEKYGPGEHQCHWCPKRLEWKDLVVDHLNEQKLDNRKENLVITCSPCNRIRGAIIPFIRNMPEERLLQLIETFGFMRSPDLDYKPFRRNPDRKRRQRRDKL